MAPGFRSSKLINNKFCSAAQKHPSNIAQNDSQDRFVAFGERSSPQIQLLKKIIPLVINHDEGGEVFDVDFPDRFHAEFGIL